jgi:hypothetical protein
MEESLQRLCPKGQSQQSGIQDVTVELSSTRQKVVFRVYDYAQYALGL